MPTDRIDDLYAIEETLPDELPTDPFSVVRRWFDEAHARKVQPNPNAMTLATVGPDGWPAARVVLCKGMNAELGYVVFYTNYRGRKGRDLEAAPRAAIVMHWDALDRQVRIEGPVVKSPAAESDAYFATRALESRIGAWASDQSEPIASREALLEKVASTMSTLGVPLSAVVDRGSAESLVIPRPPHWGGFRVWARSVELWLGGTGRVHDRARWTRDLTPAGDSFTAGAWRSTRLQP
jgi:pyridoxamine 5'-phosphate oxidase